MVDFIGTSKYIINASGENYEPSTGEKGILLLQQIISQPADAYFFDEPELGMGNSYIDANIRPQITSLAKKHKVGVNLNEVDGQQDLKDVFSTLLHLLEKQEIGLVLEIDSQYKKGLYIEVCNEYIQDLNRELQQVRTEMKSM